MSKALERRKKIMELISAQYTAPEVAKLAGCSLAAVLRACKSFGSWPEDADILKSLINKEEGLVRPSRSDSSGFGPPQ